MGGSKPPYDHERALKKKLQYKLGQGRGSRNRFHAKRNFIKLCRVRGIPVDECMMPGCSFKGDLTLDHVSGNTDDNHYQNLRLICRDCHDNLPTTGHRNIGMIVDKTDGGYGRRNDRGGIDRRVMASPATGTIPKDDE